MRLIFEEFFRSFQVSLALNKKFRRKAKRFLFLCLKIEICKHDKRTRHKKANTPSMPLCAKEMKQ